MAAKGFGTKITPHTSLHELALLRLKLGIQRIVVDYDYDGERLHRVNVLLFTPEFNTRGAGDDEVEAMDDALHRLTHRIGAACVGTVVVR